MDKKDSKLDRYCLSLGDFAVACYKRRRIISTFAGVLAAFAFIYYLTTPPLYVIEGTFQDKGKSSSLMQQTFSELILMGSSKVESEAVTFMKSRKLIERVVEALGGQAHLHQPSIEFPYFRHISRNVLLEYADWTRKRYPILADAHPTLTAREVHYAGKTPYTATVRFEDDAHFLLIDPVLAGPLQGKVGVPIVHPAFTLTLLKQTPDSLASQEFDLFLAPMDLIVPSVRAMYMVEGDKSDKNLIRIKYYDTDRHRGSDYVNVLMMVYQDHLQQEHHRIADTQLDYLEKRQGEIVANLRKVMEEYAATTDDENTIRGFSALQNESESLSKIQVETTRRLMDIDLESSRIQSMLCGGKCVYYDRYTDRGDPAIINNILQQIRDYERQSDSLIAALGPEKEAGGEPAPRKNQEFAGIDLDAAKQLHINFSRDLSDVQASIKQHTHVLGQIQDPDFEVCSLGAMLQDPVSAERIAKASSLVLALKDENNRTQKEHERIRQDLDLEKTFLKLHLKQTVQLLALKENLIIEKIRALQNASYVLTQQQIGVLHKHLNDYLASRKDNLQQEKELLNQYQKQINTKLNAIRSKLISELLVDQSIELTEKMVEELTKLVESKNISSNLELIQSAPVDAAIAPTHPVFPRLIVKTLIGAILGTLLGICWVFMGVLRKGIPATEHNLRQAGELVAGPLSRNPERFPTKPLLDRDLDTLRRAIQFLGDTTTQSVLLLTGQGYDFSPLLAQVFKGKGQSVLLLPLNFQAAAPEQNLPGLLQYLGGKAAAPKIITGPMFDRIAPGGIARLSTELLLQSRFKILLDKLHSEYNWIVGVCQAPLESAEAEALVPLFDRVIVGVTEETIDQLSAYLQQEPQADFVFIQES